jgi:hypothetical protein
MTINAQKPDMPKAADKQAGATPKIKVLFKWKDFNPKNWGIADYIRSARAPETEYVVSLPLDNDKDTRLDIIGNHGKKWAALFDAIVRTCNDGETVGEKEIKQMARKIGINRNEMKDFKKVLIDGAHLFIGETHIDEAREMYDKLDADSPVHSDRIDLGDKFGENAMRLYDELFYTAVEMCRKKEQFSLDDMEEVAKKMGMNPTKTDVFFQHIRKDDFMLSNIVRASKLVPNETVSDSAPRESRASTDIPKIIDTEAEEHAHAGGMTMFQRDRADLIGMYGTFGSLVHNEIMCTWVSNRLTGSFGVPLEAPEDILGRMNLNDPNSVIAYMRSNGMLANIRSESLYCARRLRPSDTQTSELTDDDFTMGEMLADRGFMQQSFGDEGVNIYMRIVANKAGIIQNSLDLSHDLGIEVENNKAILEGMKNTRLGKTIAEHILSGGISQERFELHDEHAEHESHESSAEDATMNQNEMMLKRVYGNDGQTAVDLYRAVLANLDEIIGSEDQESVLGRIVNDLGIEPKLATLIINNMIESNMLPTDEF